MKKAGETKKKIVKLPRQSWTIKPVTKVKQSRKAEISKTICRDKKAVQESAKE